jgi:hypothetical protein
MNDPGDQDDEVSKSFFKVEIKSINNCKYYVEGSLRIVSFLVYMLIGLIVLYFLNKLIDNGCLKQYL